MTESRVWIAQCLCPRRHCILAAAGEAAGEAEASETVLVPLRDQIGTLIAARSINPWCGLCRSPAAAWTYEVGRTRFATMDKAKPELERIARQLAVTGKLFGGAEGAA